MGNDPKPPKKKVGLVVALVLLLAVVCVAACELTVGYFLAPEWFEKTTAPVRACAHSAAEFCTRTAQRLSDRVGEVTDALAESLFPEDEEDSHSVQMADCTLLARPAQLADPTVTELKLHDDGTEYLTGGMMDLDYFNQSAAPWADQPYGTDDIARYGCGPTAMAMVVNSMTDFYTDPILMARWAVQEHHWAKKSGSYLTIVSGAAEAFGLKAYSIRERTPEALRAALLSGDLIVALMGPGHFTKGGHFIVLHGVTLSGTLLVADPNSVERSLMEWDAELILSELSGSVHCGAPLWGITRDVG